MLFSIIAAAAVAATTPQVIDPAMLSRDVKVLASDEFEGRAPGTEGERKTIAYLVEQFRAAGAEPAGENGGWTQRVEMRRHTVSPQRVLQLSGRCNIDLSSETVLWTRNGSTSVDLANAALVFAGHGVSAPDRGWDDYAGLDVKGKVLIVLPNDPDFAADNGPFGGKRMGYHARLSTKVEEAGRRGAAAVLALFDPASAEYGWELIQRTFGQPSNGVPGADLSRVAFTGYVSETSAERLLACAGRDLTRDKAAATKRGFRPYALEGVALTAKFGVNVESKVTHNVVAKLPGTERPDEYFLYTAHWDHLGRGKPDSTGDDIYNGALDNAGGTAGLLALARAFGRAPRTERSILLVAMTLEESGLLGSEYFAANPLVPLEKIAGGFNMDAVNLIGMTKTMEVTSMGQTTLEDHLKRELAAQGREMKDDPNSVAGFYYRSDHFPFAKRGVPFIFAGSGWELAEQKVPNTRDPEVGTRYHQPMDQWFPELDFAAAARDIELYYRVGRTIANSREWPKWNPGTEFAAERAKTDAVRR